MLMEKLNNEQLNEMYMLVCKLNILNSDMKTKKDEEVIEYTDLTTIDFINFEQCLFYEIKERNRSLGVF